MLGNSTITYGNVAKTFHWLIAALVLTMIPLGMIGTSLADANPIKPTIFSVHKTMGVFIFFTALARISWTFIQPKPGVLYPQRRVETFLASVVHRLLYASLVVVPLTGWVHHAATTGYAPIWWPFGQGLPFVPQSERVALYARTLHIIFERVLVLAFLVHLAAALKHHYLDRDDTLRRILPGHTVPTLTPFANTNTAAPVVAVAVYVAALAIGVSLGLFKQDRVEAAELVQATSQWQVETGEIAITVQQLGTAVDGHFAEWTAAINFNETPGADGMYGDVEVTVSVATLTLGSVTRQALGPDFLDAETHQTALFRADIMAAESGYVASGTLKLRDTEGPLALPFELTIDGDTATMTGQTVLNRSAFDIGMDTQPGDGSLGFDVAIRVALTAKR